MTFGSEIFFAGAVMHTINLLTLQAFPEVGHKGYFAEGQVEDKAKGQLILMGSYIGMYGGAMMSVSIAILAAGPPSALIQYSSAFLHGIAAWDQIIGVLGGNHAKQGMNTTPIKVWAVINTIWTVLNYIAASEEKSGQALGWSTDTWTTLFWAAHIVWAVSAFLRTLATGSFKGYKVQSCIQRVEHEPLPSV